jgi:hypothetical protein
LVEKRSRPAFIILINIYDREMRTSESYDFTQEWTIQRKQKGQSRMDNPEKLETLNTTRHGTKTNIKHFIKDK